MSKRENFGWTALIIVIAAVVGGMGLAHAQAASQPAPTGSWLTMNLSWLVPLVVALLSSLATGLSEYPKARGVVQVLRIVLGCLSVVTFKDSPGTLKVPFAPPVKPEG